MAMTSHIESHIKVKTRDKCQFLGNSSETFYMFEIKSFISMLGRYPAIPKTEGE